MPGVPPRSDRMSSQPHGVRKSGYHHLYPPPKVSFFQRSIYRAAESAELCRGNMTAGCVTLQRHPPAREQRMPLRATPTYLSLERKTRADFGADESRLPISKSIDPSLSRSGSASCFGIKQRHTEGAASKSLATIALESLSTNHPPARMANVMSSAPGST